MPKDTPSMAKNKMRRALLAIIDPHPSAAEIDLLWNYFQHSCAYCGIAIAKESRTGHLDHLVSSAIGGSNSIYNHVLSCATCNGDEKRETQWQAFLTQKVADTELAKLRHKQISNWMKLQTAPTPFSEEQQIQIDNIINQALNSFDIAVKELRRLRK